MSSDQKQFWNQRHTVENAKHTLRHDGPTPFALEVQSLIPQKSRVLEIGCGLGVDAIFFASKGHDVLATDLSEVAIASLQKKRKTRIARFQVLDISDPIDFEDESFDLVYSRLALHYFTDAVTKQMFGELHRILRPNGYLCFICKSTEDDLYGKGMQIERDMFENNGHVRHFFSEAYVRECLGNDFTISKLESDVEHFYTKDSAFVKCIATRNG